MSAYWPAVPALTKVVGELTKTTVPWAHAAATTNEIERQTRALGDIIQANRT
jgi:hypothetical protein